MSESGWIGVDLDGTLAMYDGWKGIEYIGQPIPVMLERVKKWLNKGTEVRIVTARASLPDGPDKDLIIAEIEQWCLKWIGQKLKITNEKDFSMIELWDDRAVSVEFNTGKDLRRIASCDEFNLETDAEAGARYVQLSNNIITKTKEVKNPIVVIDYDAEDEIVGIEIVGIKEKSQ